MGLLDRFKKKEEIEEKPGSEKKVTIDIANAKYPDGTCALCQGPGCDKKAMGQYWHKRCYRTVRGKGKKMI